MRETTNYKLQLPDYNNTADIEVLNENFEKLDTELNKKAGATELGAIQTELNMKMDKQIGYSLISDSEKADIQTLKERADLQWSSIKGAKYEESKDDQTEIWTTIATKNNIKIAERIEHPKNQQGQFVTIIKIYNSEGTSVVFQSTITEYKDSQGTYITEVV